MKWTNEELKTALQLKAEGLTNKAIGQKLNRSDIAVATTLSRLRSIKNFDSCTDLRAGLSTVNKNYRNSHLAQATESHKRWYDKNRRGRCSNIHRSENYRECCKRRNETRRKRNKESVEEATKHRQRWTRRDIERLTTMYRNKVTYYEIAKSLGRSERAIDRALHRYNIIEKTNSERSVKELSCENSQLYQVHTNLCQVSYSRKENKPLPGSHKPLLSSIFQEGETNESFR